MSERTKMLIWLGRAVACVSILLFILWIWVMFGSGFSLAQFYTLTALLVVSVVGGRVLRIAFTRSLHRDRSALIEVSGDVGL